MSNGGRIIELEEKVACLLADRDRLKAALKSFLNGLDDPDAQIWLATRAETDRVRVSVSTAELRHACEVLGAMK